jgi:putative addiction module CopG family antidote
MNITLSSNFEKFVQKLVESGRYDSEQQVLEAGVARLMLDTAEGDVEEIDDISAASILRSEEQIKNGQTRTLDDAITELRAKHFGK